jgi:hypothetical protein
LIICPKNKCMWEAGSARNRSGDQVSGRGARSGNTAVRVRCEDGRVPTLHRFFALPAKGAHAARSGCRHQVEAWSIGSMIRELMLMKFSH